MAKNGCLKWGCFSCGGLTILSIACFALVAGLQISNTRGPRDLQEFQFERGLPAELERLVIVEALGSGDPGSELAQSGPEQENISTEGTVALELPRLPTSQQSRKGVGRLILNVSLTDLEIRPGPPGSSITLEAEYDPSHYKLTEDFSEDSDGEWTYEVSFTGERTWLGMVTSGATSNPGNILVVRMPPDIPFDVIADIGIGEAELELGGLWVRDVSIDAGAGEFRVLFSKPTQMAMGALKIDSGVGELRVEDVGNASPSSVDLDLGVGDSRADLRGPWVRDATIRMDCGIGECALRVPDDVFLHVDNLDVGLGESNDTELPDQENVPEGAPTLTLNVSAGLGGVRIDS